MTYSI